MIQSESKLNVADNSGAKLVLCIKVLGSSKKKYAYLGDLIKITVKKCLFKGKVKKGEIYNALIVRTRSKIFRSDGSYLKFSDNAVVLLNQKLDIISSRVIGPVPRELKYTRFFKVTSLASEVL